VYFFFWANVQIALPLYFAYIELYIDDQVGIRVEADLLLAAIVLQLHRIVSIADNMLFGGAGVATIGCIWIEPACI